ncbi:MAG: Tm-1-like ATP-binding domain-containing protein [Acholeplasmataceae bacterium]|nr:Tm-1-like ATP-binding domain-containing protein [Acholeplasmataceae bacterium]
MSKKVVVLGTLDTKGNEFKFLKDIIEAQGVGTIVVDAGIFEPTFTPDVSNLEVCKAQGADLAKLREVNDRGTNVLTMMQGAAKIVNELYKKGEVGGIISLGGSGGSSIAAHVMQQLPVGVPKILVSTMGAGDVSPYVGVKDIMMMYSIVDVAGLNNILREILTNAGLAIAGIVKNKSEIEKSTKPLIAATMFGVTTPCVTTAREYLEENGYEVVVFHATGSGGKSMEGLISSGYFTGVLDITTTEWCDELVGGVLNAGPHRLDAASLGGVPQVVSVGALDMVNFGPVDTVPAKFEGRNFYVHNSTVTLMRTTAEENTKLGEIIGKKVSQSIGNAAFFIPLKGVSMIDAVGMPFLGVEEDKALFNALRKNIDTNKVELIELDLHINDKEYALAMAKKLVELINK